MPARSKITRSAVRRDDGSGGGGGSGTVTSVTAGDPGITVTPATPNPVIDQNVASYAGFNDVTWYACDQVAGNDANAGKSTVSRAAAKVVAVKTLARLMEIIPRIGTQNQVFEAAVYPGTYAEDLVVAGFTGYALPLFIALHDAADSKNLAPVTLQAGPGAGGTWTVDAAGIAVSTFKVSAGVLTAGKALLGARVRFTAGTIAGAVATISKVTGGDTIEVQHDLGVAPAAGDLFLIEDPGEVKVDNIYVAGNCCGSGGGVSLQVAGFEAVGTMSVPGNAQVWSSFCKAAIYASEGNVLERVQPDYLDVTFTDVATGGGVVATNAFLVVHAQNADLEMWSRGATNSLLVAVLSGSWTGFVDGSDGRYLIVEACGSQPGLPLGPAVGFSIGSRADVTQRPARACLQTSNMQGYIGALDIASATLPAVTDTERSDLTIDSVTGATTAAAVFVLAAPGGRYDIGSGCTATAATVFGTLGAVPFAAADLGRSNMIWSGFRDARLTRHGGGADGTEVAVPVTNAAGASLAAGLAVRIVDNSGGVAASKADAPSTAKIDGFLVTTAPTNGDLALMVTGGPILAKGDEDNSAKGGALLYLSATNAGKLTTTVPTAGAGPLQRLRVRSVLVGTATDALTVADPERISEDADGSI